MSEFSREQINVLLNEYMSLGEVDKVDMAKKYPSIDFNRLAHERIQERLAATPASTPVEGGNKWASILQVATWVIFGFFALFGIVGIGLTASTGTLGPAIFAFLPMVGFLFIWVAVSMVFVHMAKDISRTAKDTAEIKEILKNK